MKDYKSYLDHFPIGIFVIDKSGNYVDVNTMACEISGYTKDELLRLVVDSILTVHHSEKGISVIQTLLDSGEAYTELELTTKMGEVKLLSVKLVSIEDGTFMAFFTDITEQRKNALELSKNQERSIRLFEELKQSELRFRSFVESSESAVVFLSTNFKILEFNPVAERIFESKRESVINKDFLLLFARHVDPRSIRQEGLQISIEKLSALFLNELLHSSGKKYNVSWMINKIIDREGTIHGYAAVGRDITEWLAMEDALKKSERQYRILFRELLDGLVLGEGIFDGVTGEFTDGRILSVNPAFEKLTGKSAIDVIGKSVLEVFPLIEQELLDALGKAITEDTPLRMEMFSRSLQKNLEIIAFPTQKGHLALMMKDITERTIAQEKLKSSLMEKEVMLKEIHHRVKNNLQVISSLLDLQALSFEDALTQEAFRESQNRVKSMAIIHEKIYRSIDLSRIDLKLFIEELIVHLLSSYKVHADMISINEELESTNMKLESAVPCGLIINELISNVFKHAFPKGRRGNVDVKLKKESEDRVTITIHDDGVGLPEGFDYKNTTSLGFQLIDALSEQLNAEMTLHSENGTTISISFVVAQ
ncbi:MAG: PAS domain S-box protein [Ignavibacteria bacterium]|nr:PAS domain S-box protein [Ignavibacteria bacterium]